MSAKRLNREQTGAGDTQEVVWSCGETLPVAAVMQAFKLAPEQSAALQRDALPLTFSGSAVKWILIIIVVLVIVVMLSRCGSGGGGSCESTRSTYGQSSVEYQNCVNSSRSGTSYGTSGGAFGGFSSGGSHK